MLCLIELCPLKAAMWEAGGFHGFPKALRRCIPGGGVNAVIPSLSPYHPGTHQENKLIEHSGKRQDHWGLPQSPSSEGIVAWLCLFDGGLRSFITS